MPVEELVDPGTTPEEALNDDQRRATILKALAMIPAEKREMIVLRDYLDLSYAQIADVLGIAQGTVMSRLHRSRLALKEALDKDGQ